MPENPSRRSFLKRGLGAAAGAAMIPKVAAGALGTTAEGTALEAAATGTSGAIGTLTKMLFPQMVGALSKHINQFMAEDPSTFGDARTSPDEYVWNPENGQYGGFDVQSVAKQGDSYVVHATAGVGDEGGPSELIAILDKNGKLVHMAKNFDMTGDMVVRSGEVLPTNHVPTETEQNWIHRIDNAVQNPEDEEGLLHAKNLMMPAEGEAVAPGEYSMTPLANQIKRGGKTFWEAQNEHIDRQFAQQQASKEGKTEGEVAEETAPTEAEAGAAESIAPEAEGGLVSGLEKLGNTQLSRRAFLQRGAATLGSTALPQKGLVNIESLSGLGSAAAEGTPSWMPGVIAKAIPFFTQFSFSELAPSVQAEFESYGLTPENIASGNYTTEALDKADALMSKISEAFEEEDGPGSVWDEYGLSGDDDVDYNVGYPSTAIDMLRKIKSAKTQAEALKAVTDDFDFRSHIDYLKDAYENPAEAESMSDDELLADEGRQRELSQQRYREWQKSQQEAREAEEAKPEEAEPEEAEEVAETTEPTAEAAESTAEPAAAEAAEAGGSQLVNTAGLKAATGPETPVDPELADLAKQAGQDLWGKFDVPDGISGSYNVSEETVKSDLQNVVNKKFDYLHEITHEPKWSGSKDFIENVIDSLRRNEPLINRAYYMMGLDPIDVDDRISEIMSDALPENLRESSIPYDDEDEEGGQEALEQLEHVLGSGGPSERELIDTKELSRMYGIPSESNLQDAARHLTKDPERIQQAIQNWKDGNIFHGTKLRFLDDILKNGLSESAHEGQETLSGTTSPQHAEGYAKQGPESLMSIREDADFDAIMEEEAKQPGVVFKLKMSPEEMKNIEKSSHEIYSSKLDFSDLPLPDISPDHIDQEGSYVIQPDGSKQSLKDYLASKDKFTQEDEILEGHNPKEFTRSEIPDYATDKRLNDFDKATIGRVFDHLDPEEGKAAYDRYIRYLNYFDNPDPIDKAFTMSWSNDEIGNFSEEDEGAFGLNHQQAKSLRIIEDYMSRFKGDPVIKAIDPNKTQSFQSHINPEILDKYIKRGQSAPNTETIAETKTPVDKGLPVIFDIDGKMYVEDGNHRIEAARQLGRDIRVRYLNYQEIKAKAIKTGSRYSKEK